MTLLVSDGDWTALVEAPLRRLGTGGCAAGPSSSRSCPGFIARARGERFEGKKTVFGDSD